MIVPQSQQLQTVPVGGVFWHVDNKFWGIIVAPAVSGQSQLFRFDTNVLSQNGGSDNVLYFPEAKLVPST